MAQRRPTTPAPGPARVPAPIRVLVALNNWSGYNRAVAAGVADYARQHSSWELIPFCSYWKPIPTFEWSLDGAPEFDAAIAEAPHGSRLLQDLIADGRPAVAVIGGGEPRGLPAVVSDNQAIARLAFEHLASLGFERFGFCDTGDWSFADARLSAFRQAVERRGGRLYTLRAAPDSLDRDLAAWLQHVPKPIAVFAALSRIALVLARVCRKYNVSVPEQVAILGADDDDAFCLSAAPNLSAVDQGARQVGYQAAQLLERVLRGQARNDEVVHVSPVGVIQRQSTDILAIDDPVIAQAVRFIREHACDGICVEDVLDHAPVSRRKLEMEIKRILKRTVSQEILRVQIERAKVLLGRTDLGGEDISARCGFSCRPRFYATFRQATGMTPKQYRLQSRQCRS